jgi:trehalose 6-phosphate synthase/phosphatase
MPEEERMRRISIASEFVTRVTTQRWALAVMLDLKGVHKNVNPVHHTGAGLGLGYRLLGMDTGFVSLDFNVVAKAFKNARTRLILVDYGGTIVSNDNVSRMISWLVLAWLDLLSFALFCTKGNGNGNCSLYIHLVLSLLLPSLLCCSSIIS